MNWHNADGQLESDPDSQQTLCLTSLNDDWIASLFAADDKKNGIIVQYGWQNDFLEFYLHPKLMPQVTLVRSNTQLYFQLKLHNLNCH